MTSAPNRRLSWLRRPRSAALDRDPAARFAHDLATQPPTKDVASVKAASDAYVSGLRSDEPTPSPEAAAKRSRDR